MLGVKLARAVMKRQMIIKAWDGYHGSFDDLEAGLYGQGEMPGRVALARFGDLQSYIDALDRHPGKIAAIVVEPVQYTGIVTTPPPGFLGDATRALPRCGCPFRARRLLDVPPRRGRLGRAVRNR